MILPSVRLSVTWEECAKMSGCIEVLLGLVTCGAKEHRVRHFFKAANKSYFGIPKLCESCGQILAKSHKFGSEIRGNASIVTVSVGGCKCVAVIVCVCSSFYLGFNHFYAFARLYRRQYKIRCHVFGSVCL